jgi:type III secretion protein K
MSMISLCDRSLIVFNFLPSTTLHPSRQCDYGCAPFATAATATPALSAIWHRHWSRHILRQEGLAGSVVMDPACAGLELAILPPADLSALARRIGAVLCAPRLRYAISGEDVRALQDALGADALRLAKMGSPIHPGLGGAMFRDAGEAVATVEVTGYAALHAAFQAATPAVARRFFLKLPSSATAEAFNGGHADIDADTAMALAVALAKDSTGGGADGVSA